jgi:hypothetical protein
MYKVSGYNGIAYPFYSPMAPVTVVCTASYNKRAADFENCKNAFLLASTILDGHDVIEEFVASDVWPIPARWKPASIVSLTVDWAVQQVPFLDFTCD